MNPFIINTLFDYFQQISKQNCGQWHRFTIRLGNNTPRPIINRLTVSVSYIVEYGFIFERFASHFL